MPAVSPDKLYYRIGEVATLTSLRPSVLRFWETEFGMLQPRKSRTGQRLYSQEDLALIHQIKRLLYRERMTIEGARQKLAVPGSKQDIPHVVAADDVRTRELLKEIKAELELIRGTL